MGKVSNKAVKDKAREIGFAEVVHVLTDHFGADFVSVSTEYPLEKMLFKELLKVGIMA